MVATLDLPVHTYRDLQLFTAAIVIGSQYANYLGRLANAAANMAHTREAMS